MTLLDQFQLDSRQVDEILPMMMDLGATLDTYPNLPADYEGRAMIEKWVQKMKAMNAADSITEEESRELSH